MQRKYGNIRKGTVLESRMITSKGEGIILPFSLFFCPFPPFFLSISPFFYSFHISLIQSAFYSSCLFCIFLSFLPFIFPLISPFYLSIPPSLSSLSFHIFLLQSAFLFPFFFASFYFSFHFLPFIIPFPLSTCPFTLPFLPIFFFQSHSSILPFFLHLSPLFTSFLRDFSIHWHRFLGSISILTILKLNL